MQLLGINQPLQITPEQITILKNILQQVDCKILAWVLMESISYNALNTWLDDDELMGLDSFLATIQDKFPELEDRSVSLFKVIKTLAAHPQVATSIKGKLEQWLNIFPGHGQNFEFKTFSKLTPYLMAVISQSRPNKPFELTAFLQIADKPSIPIRLRNKTESKPYQQNPKNSYLCTSKNWRDLVVWLKDVIEQSENLYLKGCPCGYELNVEMFLPFDYLAEKVDLWEIRRIGRRKRKLGQEYSFIIRSLERINDGYYENKLKRVWIYLSSSEHYYLVDSIKYLKQQESCEYSELEAELVGQKMIGLACHLPEDCENLFEVLLETGIPLALWSRPNDCDCQFQNLLSQILKKPEDLIRAVFQQRQQAHRHRQNPESQWGYHLAMLLDNPNRTPPSQFLQTPGT